MLFNVFAELILGKFDENCTTVMMYKDIFSDENDHIDQFKKIEIQYEKVKICNYLHLFSFKMLFLRDEKV